MLTRSSHRECWSTRFDHPSSSVQHRLNFNVQLVNYYTFLPSPSRKWSIFMLTFTTWSDPVSSLKIRENSFSASETTDLTMGTSYSRHANSTFRSINLIRPYDIFLDEPAQSVLSRACRRGVDLGSVARDARGCYPSVSGWARSEPASSRDEIRWSLMNVG